MVMVEGDTSSSKFLNFGKSQWKTDNGKSETKQRTLLRKSETAMDMIE